MCPIVVPLSKKGELILEARMEQSDLWKTEGVQGYSFARLVV